MSVTALDKNHRWRKSGKYRIPVGGPRWNWPRENRRLASVREFWKHWVLRISKIILVGVVAGTLIWLQLTLKDPNVFPIELVRIEGDWHYLQRSQIRHVLQPELAVSFFSLDVRDIHQKLQSIPWVDSVSIKRKWPGTVAIQVLERKPVAYWQQTKLLDRELRVFSPDEVPVGLALPKLSGPSSQSQAIYLMFQEFNQRLSALQLKIDRFTMDDRHSLELWLDNGVQVTLGAESVRKRFHNFIRIYPHLVAEEETAIDSIDMRYPNGMAVRRGSRLSPEVGEGSVTRSSQ